MELIESVDEWMRYLFDVKAKRIYMYIYNRKTAIDGWQRFPVQGNKRDTNSVGSR